MKHITTQAGGRPSRRRRGGVARGLVAGAIVAAAGLAGVGASASTTVPDAEAEPTTPAISDEEWAEIVAAAEAEGALTIYISDNFARSGEIIEQLFEEEYDIDVTLNPGHSRDHRERIFAEYRSGNVHVDIAQFGVGTATQMIAEGVLATLDVPSKGLVEERFVVFDEVVVYHALPQGLLVNTDVIEEVPTSYADLADERFNDQLIMDDPRREGGGNTVFISLINALGEDFVRELEPNVTIVTEAQEEAIARGDYGVLIGGEPRFIDRFESAPLTWVAPDEGAIVLPMSWGLIDGAPHPNAARVWVEFTLRPDIQSIISTAAVPVIPGTEIVNPHMAIEQTLPVIGPDVDRQATFSLAEDIFGIR